MNMTTKAMNAMIGRTYTAILTTTGNTLRGLRVTVYVLDTRERYGNLDCQVTPLENVRDGSPIDPDNVIWMQHDKLF